MSELVETLQHEIECLKQKNRTLYNRLKNTNRSKLRLKKTINNQQNLIKTLTNNINYLEKPINTENNENNENTKNNENTDCETNFVWEDVNDLLIIKT